MNDVIHAASAIVADKVAADAEQAAREIHERNSFVKDPPRRPRWLPAWACKCTCMVRVLTVRVPFVLECGCVVPSEPVSVRWRRPGCWRHQSRRARS